MKLPKLNTYTKAAIITALVVIVIGLGLMIITAYPVETVAYTLMAVIFGLILFVIYQLYNLIFEWVQLWELKRK